MYGGSVLCKLCPHQSRIYGNDVSGWKVVSKGDLDRHALLGHDHSAKVCGRNTTVYAKRVGRNEPPGLNPHNVVRFGRSGCKRSPNWPMSIV
jgi:hypothetical protein